MDGFDRLGLPHLRALCRLHKPLSRSPRPQLSISKTCRQRTHQRSAMVSATARKHRLLKVRLSAPIGRVQLRVM